MSKSIEEIKNQEYRRDLEQISSDKLKDFIGWYVLATDIDIVKEDIEYYIRVVNEHKIGVLLTVKGKDIYAEGHTHQKAEEEIINVAAQGYFKLIE